MRQRAGISPAKAGLLADKAEGLRAVVLGPPPAAVSMDKDAGHPVWALAHGAVRLHRLPWGIRNEPGHVVDNRDSPVSPPPAVGSRSRSQSGQAGPDSVWADELLTRRRAENRHVRPVQQPDGLGRHTISRLQRARRKRRSLSGRHRSSAFNTSSLFGVGWPPVSAVEPR